MPLYFLYIFHIPFRYSLLYNSYLLIGYERPSPMEFGSYKIPIFSENPVDFQQWKFKFINLVGLGELRHRTTRLSQLLVHPPHSRMQMKRLKHLGRGFWWIVQMENRFWGNIFIFLTLHAARPNISQSICEQIRDYDGTKAWKMLLTRYARSDNLRVMNYVWEPYSSLSLRGLVIWIFT